MTNLLASLVVTLTLSTNWTGVVCNGKELGYVVTNHLAEVVYEGETNVFTLKSVAGRVAVWKPYEGSVGLTNMMIPWRFESWPNSGMLLTNVSW